MDKIFRGEFQNSKGALSATLYRAATKSLAPLYPKDWRKPCHRQSSASTEIQNHLPKIPSLLFLKALTGFKRNYAAYEVELYVVMLAVKRFQMFLLNNKALYRTDYVGFRYLMRLNLSRLLRSNVGICAS